MRRLLLALLLLSSACALQPYRDLDPESREFLSLVRYVITQQETRVFLALPVESRPGFIVDFWISRDPTPGTVRNEFKETYLQRIAETNFLFGDYGPGWLSDRGRVYILVGPPTDRLTYPRGATFYGVPSELWYYGWFTILFVDERWVGDYRLSPSSAEQLAKIMAAAMEGRR